MDITIFLYTALVVVVIFIFRWFNEDEISKHVNKLPGYTRLPFFGTALSMLFVPREDVIRKGKQHIGKFGKISRSWFGNIPVIDIVAAETAEPILKSSENISKGFTYDFAKPWLGEGLLLSTGTKWFRHRKLITPTFHFQILENFMEVFVEKSKLLADHLSAEANGKVFDIYPYITHCTLDIICETAMGVEMKAMFNKDNEYIKAIYGMGELFIHRTLRPWLTPDWIFRNTSKGKQYDKNVTTLHNFTKKVIKEKKEALNRNITNPKNNENDLLGKKKRLAFLDLLIESSGTILSDQEIREEVDTFMFEGHDTTTSAICWTLFLLGNYPEYQDEVYKEIENLFQGEDKNLTINDLNELKLLERCIKESLRLYPIAPVITRKITKDIQIGEHFIPAGCTATIHIHLIHKDEKHFPEPNRFNPDRFLPENMKNRHPYAYIPFSAGSRNCIGQKLAMYEEKTLLTYILRKFKIKAIENEETVIPLMDFILRSKNGTQVTLVPRV